MTDTDIEQLEQKERELWARVEAARVAMKPAEDEWLAAFNALHKAKLKREVMEAMRTQGQP